MEALQKFGLDPLLLAAQVVNFLIILAILKKFAYKPILSLLKKRQEAIRQSLEQAEKTKKLLEETAEKEKLVLRAAQTQATKLLDHAKKEANNILAIAEVAAKKEQEKIMKETKSQIQEEILKAKQELIENVSFLAIRFLEKTAKELFTEKDQKDIMSRAMTKMKKKADL